MTDKKDKGKENEEIVMTINLRRAYEKPRTKRLKTAVKLLRDAVKRFAKVNVVKISNSINQLFFKKSIKKPPRKLKIKVIKEKEQGRVE
ncbi:MAG: 50S ribosomal protein L31e, partial [Candidatus Anstonellales archaeon]